MLGGPESVLVCVFTQQQLSPQPTAATRACSAKESDAVRPTRRSSPLPTHQSAQPCIRPSSCSRRLSCSSRAPTPHRARRSSSATSTRATMGPLRSQLASWLDIYLHGRRDVRCELPPTPPTTPGAAAAASQKISEFLRDFELRFVFFKSQNSLEGPNS